MEKFEILVVTEDFPYPPRNGKQLPIARIFQYMPEHVEIDFLLINQKGDLQTDEIMPAQVRNVFLNNCQVLSKSKRITQWLLQGKNFSRYDLSSLDLSELKGKSYDIVWVSPITLHDSIQLLRNNKVSFDKIGIGLNDVKTYQYRDVGAEIVKTGTFNLTFLLMFLRSFLIAFDERRILKTFDLIHIQTEKEKEKLAKLLSKGEVRDKAMVVQNGKNDAFLSVKYKGVDSKTILLNTQMKMRKAESKWFLEKVWPRILKEIPDAQLKLFGQVSDPLPEYVKNAKNTSIEGFVDNLNNLFESVSVVVVPTFHSTGLINRILDALTCGIPTVTTTPACATFPDLKPGTHILVADEPEEFARSVISLLRDKGKLLDIHKAAHEWSYKFPSWRDSSSSIYNFFTA